MEEEIERLKKLSDDKTDIISITAHQLRTSLSALKWILKMLIDEDVGKLNKDQSELMDKAYSSNENMLALVNDLLTLNHSADALFKYDFQKIDFLHLLEKTLTEFSGETCKKEIELILEKKESSFPLLKCDEGMIHIVLQNLIENSIKYSNAGDKVHIFVEQKDNYIQVSVRDNGIGIKIDDRDNIFKKFFRAPNAKEKDAIGSGLGLFTTKNIIDRHRGKIWFENNEGKGTTFFIRLPISE